MSHWPTIFGTRCAQSIFLATCLAFSNTGCDQSPGVITRQVPKKDRTIVAYVPRDGEVWFVKLSGPAAFVDPLEQDYRALVDSMVFDDKSGEPKFELPDGWAKKPGSAMRFATYGPDGPMETAITRLPADDPSDDDYIDQNVKRWLRELGQPPRSGGWREETEQRDELEVTTIAGTEAYLFDLRGVELPAESSVIITADPYLDYAVPDGWSEQPADAFRLALLQAPGDVEVSISSAGGSPVANINRWEGQLGNTPTPETELVQKLETLEVGGRSAGLIRLDGKRSVPGTDEPVPSSIIGVIAIDGEKQYFIKAIGPTEAVDASEESFREFLDSIDFG